MSSTDSQRHTGFVPGERSSSSLITELRPEFQNDIDNFAQSVYDLADNKANENNSPPLQQCIDIHLQWLQSKQHQESGITDEDMTNVRFTTSRLKGKKSRTTHHATHVATGISTSRNSKNEARQELRKELTKHLNQFRNLVRLLPSDPLPHVRKALEALTPTPDW
ncbi:MAG: hypothetical protein U9Q67_01000 [Patescibacteria group bacterium]|nr:hypothetical protein [Patescibacteria group bacterium]